MARVGLLFSSLPSPPLANTLLRTSLRSLLRRHWLSLLCVLGIALGVAVVVAIDLANESARRAFRLATESVTGRATHHIVGGTAGVDETLYGRLRVELGERLIAPVVESYVMAEELGGQQFRLLGVDPFAEPVFRSYLSPDAGLRPDTGFDALVPLLAEPNTVLLSEDVAARFGVSPGDRVQVQVGSRVESLRVVGLLAPDDEFSRRALSSLLLTDIATAQEVLGQLGRLSRIDVLAPPAEPEGQARLARIAAALPPDAQIVEAASRTQAVQQLTGAFELNLSALSLLALVVGTFLIYNMMTFSIVQRRPTLGTLRALGVTRREIFALILVEAGLLGLLGSLLGLGLGIALGRGAVSLVTQTINDLYFSITVRGVVISPLVLAKGFVLGMLAVFVATLVPAYEATSVPPAGTLQRSTVETRVRSLIPGVTAGGLALLGIGTLLFAVPTRNLILSFGGVLAIVLGFAALTPGLMLLITHLTAQPLGSLLGPLGRIAPRTLSGSLSRTALAIAALMVAVSVSVGVGLMIHAFRLTVDRWLGSTLQADVYISAPGPANTQADAPLDPALEARVAAVRGVETIEALRNVQVESPDLGQVTLAALEWQRPRQADLFACATGGPTRAQAAFADGAVLLSEPFAYRHRLTCGDQLVLVTDAGPRSFPVAAVFYDYSSDRGLIRLDLDSYRSLWRDPLISALAIYAAPDEDVDQLVIRLQNTLAGEALLIRSNRGLREAALGIFDRTFAITYALQLLAVLVAFIGILSALMALQLERTREFGTLRAIGLTPGQLWRLTLLETGLMGGLAGVLALPAGLALAAILVYVINRRSFGWTIQFAIAPGTFVQALLIAVLAAWLAGLYPAWRLARLSPAEAIRNE